MRTDTLRGGIDEGKLASKKVKPLSFEITSVNYEGAEGGRREITRGGTIDPSAV